MTALADAYTPGATVMFGRVQTGVIERAITAGGIRAARALIRLMSEYQPAVVVADHGHRELEITGCSATARGVKERRFVDHLTALEHMHARALLTRVIGDACGPVVTIARLLAEHGPQVWELGAHLASYNQVDFVLNLKRGDGAFRALVPNSLERAQILRAFAGNPVLFFTVDDLPAVIDTLQRARAPQHSVGQLP